MHQPLIILSPPRSFSSVVSTMIGQHPQLYAFPELSLFAFSDLQNFCPFDKKEKLSRDLPGLIRTIAQEHHGQQTTQTNLKAIEWLRERRDWSTEKIFNYLLDLISPRIGVEKTPITSRRMQNLERAYAMFPNAHFLHLTRHPISAKKSIEELSTRKNLKHYKKTGTWQDNKYGINGLLVWLHMHNNIVKFTKTLPVGQTMRIKGENILSQPDVYLPQIAQWLGLRTDTEAIEAMKHPENSPYAYVGASPAHGGNDLKFMRNPKLRRGTVKEPNLQEFWQSNLSQQFEEANFNSELQENINNLAFALGYQ